MRRRVDWFAVGIFKFFLPGFFLLFLIPKLVSGDQEVSWGGYAFMALFLAHMTGYMLFLAGIWIDGNKLVIKRFGKRVELNPGQIGDWEALSWPPVARLHFLVDTPFGSSVLFMPRKLPDWTYGGENTDSYDMLADFKNQGSK